METQNVEVLSQDHMAKSWWGSDWTKALGNRTYLLTLYYKRYCDASEIEVLVHVNF